MKRPPECEVNCKFGDPNYVDDELCEFCLKQQEKEKRRKSKARGKSVAKPKAGGNVD